MYIYICIVRTRAFHAQRMFVSVLSATRIRDPAQLSVSRLVWFGSFSFGSVRWTAPARPSGLERPIRAEADGAKLSRARIDADSIRTKASSFRAQETNAPHSCGLERHFSSLLRLWGRLGRHFSSFLWLRSRLERRFSSILRLWGRLEQHFSIFFGSGRHFLSFL